VFVIIHNRLTNPNSHSQEYVAKLKFRYVEQSAKEDFIKALSSAPVDGDMALLASETAAAKATLKEAKVQLDATFAKHRELAEQIAEEDARVSRQTEEAQTLAKEITDMQLELARLRRDHPIADVSR
jgi:seryl-tRNA synthetase